MINHKYYKTNHRLYIGLLILSCCIVAISFAFPKDSRWFTVVSGLGCGAFASVLVAWLIEYSNCKHRNKRNSEIVESALTEFILGVKNALINIVNTCASHDSSVDVEKKYTFDQVVTMLENADGLLKEWDMIYHNLGVCINGIDVSTLLVYEPTPQHMEIHSLICNMQQMHVQTDFIGNNYSVSSYSGGTLAYSALKSELKNQIKEVLSIAWDDDNVLEVELPKPLKNGIINQRSVEISS